MDFFRRDTLCRVRQSLDAQRPHPERGFSLILTFHPYPGTVFSMKALLHTGLHGRVSVTSKKRFLIKKELVMKFVSLLALLCTTTFVCAQQPPATPAQPYQVEIQVQFVAFELAQVEKISLSGINASSLTTLWTNGFGQLIATPTLLTRSGVEGSVRAVTECIYPTEFAVCQSGASNTNSSAITSIVEPRSFETREVGVILTALPEICPSSQQINLTLTPQIVEGPVWQEFGGKYVDANGNQQEARMPQPFFHTLTLTTQIIVASGHRILISGGMPMRDSKRVVFAFLTARIVGI